MANEIELVLELDPLCRGQLIVFCREKNCPVYSGWFGCTDMDSEAKSWVHEGAEASILSSVAWFAFEQEMKDKRRKQDRANECYAIPVDTMLLLTFVQKHLADRGQAGAVSMGDQPMADPAERWAASCYGATSYQLHGADSRGLGETPREAVLNLLKKVWVKP